MQIDAISSINLTNTALTLYNLSDSIKRRLIAAGISTEGITSNEEAEAILAEKGIESDEKKTKKVEETKTETSSVSYYDEELIFDIKRLASDLGMYVPEDIDMEERNAYEMLQGFCIYNMKQEEKANRIIGSLCLTKLVENCPIVLQDK